MMMMMMVVTSGYVRLYVVYVKLVI